MGGVPTGGRIQPQSLGERHGTCRHLPGSFPAAAYGRRLRVQGVGGLLQEAVGAAHQVCRHTTCHMSEFAFASADRMSAAWYLLFNLAHSLWRQEQLWTDSVQQRISSSA